MLYREGRGPARMISGAEMLAWTFGLEVSVAGDVMLDGD
jgi:hypothetical protein